jgi:hypothetical protein
MKQLVLSAIAAGLAYLPISDSYTPPDRTKLDSPTKTVLLVSRSGSTFIVVLDDLRARFCLGEGSGPCYDHTVVYGQLDNCGWTAFPISEIQLFETSGGTSSAHCIRATRSATLTTAEEEERVVYVQDRYWSIVGTEVGTAEKVLLPFHDLLYLQQRELKGGITAHAAPEPLVCVPHEWPGRLHRSSP